MHIYTSKRFYQRLTTLLERHLLSIQLAHQLTTGACGCGGEQLAGADREQQSVSVHVAVSVSHTAGGPGSSCRHHHHRERQQRTGPKRLEKRPSECGDALRVLGSEVKEQGRFPACILSRWDSKDEGKPCLELHSASLCQQPEQHLLH